jgi:hypothetical protein
VARNGNALNSQYPKMKKKLLMLICAASVSCTRPDAATKALQDAGYTHVEITGYRFFTCDEKDNFSTGFRAIGPTGRPVSGTVCSGFLKANTIRLD